MEALTQASNCEKCGNPLLWRLLPRYLDPPIGIGGVVLEDAVIESYCSTCGAVADLTIPNLVGLIAAVGIVRCTLPLKLNGEEIRFLRRAVGWAAKDMAQKLNVRAETVSRWERDEDPIGPGYEKALRMGVALKLIKDAPRITFSVDDVLDLDLRGIRESGSEPEMVFRLVPLRPKKTPLPTSPKAWEARPAA